jgi:hypothetical protein
MFASTNNVLNTIETERSMKEAKSERRTKWEQTIFLNKVYESKYLKKVKSKKPIFLKPQKLKVSIEKGKKTLIHALCMSAKRHLFYI